MSTASDAQHEKLSWVRILLVFLRLGVTSFGGPVAHLGYFREEFVTRRAWLGERAYADLVALCQFLPGPASSQVGLAIGLSRGGIPGALAAWVGFTAPSAIALVLVAFGVTHGPDALAGGALAGLKAVAVAVVAQALWGMAQTLCPDAPRVTIAAVAAILILAAGTALAQIGVIFLAGLLGVFLLKGAPADSAQDRLHISIDARLSATCLVAFFALLVGLPVLAQAFDSAPLRYIDSFYRAGSLVFGGGHVVLPLLQAEVVTPGWVTPEHFVAGYGAAQAVPGPLFTFAAFLGASADAVPGAWAESAFRALICLVAIFLPSFLLVFGVLPHWARLSTAPRMRNAMAGVNAAVVGLLLAALYDPVWTTGVRSGADFSLALGAFVLLVTWRVPPWLVIPLAATAGWALTS